MIRELPIHFANHCSNSGGTLSAGLWRLASTIIGAFAAWAVLEIDGGSGVLLSGFAVVLGNYEITRDQ